MYLAHQANSKQMINYIHKFIHHTTNKLTRDRSFQDTRQPFSPGNLVDNGLHEHDIREILGPKNGTAHISHPFNQVIFHRLFSHTCLDPVPLTYSDKPKGKEVQIQVLKTYGKHYFSSSSWLQEPSRLLAAAAGEEEGDEWAEAINAKLPSLHDFRIGYDRLMLFRFAWEQFRRDLWSAHPQLRWYGLLSIPPSHPEIHPS